jgi:hypothetical protein
MRSPFSPSARKQFTFDAEDTRRTPDKRIADFLLSPGTPGGKVPPPPPPPPPPAQGQGSALTAAQQAAITAATHAKRFDTIKSELGRVLDYLQSKINSDGPLRLYSHYYAVLFVSDRPWEAIAGEETLTAALSHIRTDKLQSFSASWLHANRTVSPARETQDFVWDDAELTEEAGGPETGTGLYEYWLVLKFDATAYPVCADFYEDVRIQDQLRRAEGQGGSNQDLSLQSPISYHNIQAQV